MLTATLFERTPKQVLDAIRERVDVCRYGVDHSQQERCLEPFMLEVYGRRVEVQLCDRCWLDSLYDV